MSIDSRRILNEGLANKLVQIEHQKTDPNKISNQQNGRAKTVLGIEKIFNSFDFGG
jgi:hypothetical protein